MKLNFKRIASVLTGAVMLSSTVALAAAANFPAPFTSGETAIVYGSTVGTGSDYVKATAISSKLTELRLADASSAAPTTVTTITGEAKAVKTASTLYLGEAMNNVKASFTSSDLKTILAEKDMTDKDGNTITVKQKILTPTASIKYGEYDSDEDMPALYADFSNDETYTLEASFTPVNVTRLKDKSITLFGKQYSFSSNEDELTPTSVTLVAKADAVRVNNGEAKTINGHQVSVDVDSGTTAILTIDGESEDVEEGEDYKIAGVDVYVKNVFNQDYAGGTSFADIYFNSEKMTLETGQPVVFGTEDLEGTLVTISANSDNKVSKISIAVTPNGFNDEIENVKMGSSFIDPVFGGVKFSFADAAPALDADSREDIVVKATGDEKASLSFTNKDDKKYNLDIFTNASSSAANTNVTLGTTRGYAYATSTSTYVAENDFFITCDGEYSQIWQITNIDVADQEVTVKEQISGGAEAIITSMSGTVNGSTSDLALAGGSDATLFLNQSETTRPVVKVSKACNYLYTMNGAKIDLSDIDGAGATSKLWIIENTDYNGDDAETSTAAAIGDQKVLGIALTYEKDSTTGKDIRVSVASNSTSTFYTDSVGEDDDYYVTQYGTFVKSMGGDDTTVTFAYDSEALAPGFYVGEVSSTISGEDGDVGKVLLVKDVDAASLTGSNLIVVGGSCINTVAAKLLGSTTPLCGTDFTAKTQVGTGQYLIKTYESPYNSAKIATLVAGYEAKDTENAVDYLLGQTVSTAKGDAYKTGVKLTVGSA